MSRRIPPWPEPEIVELENAGQYLERGDHFFQMARYEEAARDYEQSLRLDARHAGGLGWLRLGRVLARLGEHFEAISVYREAVRLPCAAHEPTAWLCLAALLERSGALGEAIVTLDEYLSAHAERFSSAPVWLERGRLLSRLGRPSDSARSYLEAVLRDASTAADAGDHFLFTRVDDRSAAALYDRHPEAHRESTVLVRRAVASLLVGKEPRARRLWSRAIRRARVAERFARLWAAASLRTTSAVVTLAEDDATEPMSGAGTDD